MQILIHTRTSVTLAIIIRLYFLHSQQSSSDFVFDGEATAIATQILISVAITTACVPSLKPFLDSFESGALRVDLGRSGGDLNSNSYQLSKMNKSGSRSKTTDTNGRVDSRPDKAEYFVDISGHGSRRRRNHESDSFESENSDAMIIKRTDEWTVQYDRNDEMMRPATSSGSRSEH